MDADDRGVWCGRCEGRMRAETGRKFPGNREWLWWRCEACGHCEGVAPLPMVRGRQHGMAHLQGDPACNTASTTPVHGGSSENASSRATLTVVP